MESDQEILAKISQLAGQINRHKNNQGSEQFQPAAEEPSAKRQQINSYATRAHSHHGAYRGRGRGGYSTRGYRGGKPPPSHRHRTLVLNGGTATPPTSENNDIQVSEADSEKNTNNGPSYVSKQGRHRQLINTSILEKDSQDRAKAYEETRKRKLMERDASEKNKFTRHLQAAAGSAYPRGNRGGLQPHPAGAPTNYEINVNGIRFQAAKDGSKLIKVSGDLAKATPKQAMVFGVRFYRSKNGNLYRAGVIKTHRKNAMVKKKNEPCRLFSTTGSCIKGPRCRFVHDPSKTAICKAFLKGSCPSGESCDLSHDSTPERSPACLHFLRGNCSNANCLYAHVRVSPTAPVCRAFGIYGYCEKGAQCEDRHVFECPDFSNTGKCEMKGCKLLHREKASVLRKIANRGEASADDNSSDLSSDDDDEEIDSDDVDSDDLDEEFLGDDHEPDVDAMQQDYVQLS